MTDRTKPFFQYLNLTAEKKVIGVLVAVILYFMMRDNNQREDYRNTIKDLRNDGKHKDTIIANFGIRYDRLSDKYVNLSLDVVETLQNGQKRQDSINKLDK